MLLNLHRRDEVIEQSLPEDLDTRRREVECIGIVVRKGILAKIRRREVLDNIRIVRHASRHIQRLAVAGEDAVLHVGTPLVDATVTISVEGGVSALFTRCKHRTSDHVEGRRMHP